MINLATILKLTRPLNVFDLETTGTGDDARVVQVAITLHYPDNTTTIGPRAPLSWQSLVNPEVLIPPGATKVHGITDVMVKDAPKFSDLMANRLMERAFTNVDYCGFNVRFDLGVMKRECKRVNHPWNWEEDDSQVIDGLRIFQQKHPRDLSAAYLTYIGAPLEKAHDAAVDLVATEMVIQAQLLKHPDLPRDVPSLALVCSGDVVDKTGKLKWSEGEAVLRFGKYNGKSLKSAIKLDKQYFEKFVLGGDFPGDFKKIVADGLAGRFPAKEIS